MRTVTTLVLVTSICSTATAAQSAPAAYHHHLMPVPASVRFESGTLPMTPSLTVSVDRYRDTRLLRAVDRAITRLSARTGMAITHALAPDSTATLVIEVHGPGEAVQSVAEDESYTLDATPQRMVLRANTVVGALRGLETVQQLVESDQSGYFFPLAHIADQPRFPWRGLLIDVSRHWEPVGVIERNLDAMAAVKLNVLHWHLSDDQGFRIESKRFPKLQQLGSDSLYYTQQDVRNVVAYARDRGIRVVPEFDMPGHSTTWFVAYPQYASGPGPYTIDRAFGGAPGSFDPTRETVYRFIDRFVGEIGRLFPDAYWHIGGDENNGRQWNESPRIQAFMKRHRLRDNAALQAYFNQRLLKIFTRHHKHVVGWDEILHPDLPKDIVVQSWRGTASLAASAKQGFNGILSAPYYLDAMAPASKPYLSDPLPATSDLSPVEAARILGGEACMWGELITPENIDSRIWPRSAAIAERFWSPRDVNDVDDMYRRLGPTGVELEAVGAQQLSGPDRMLRRLAGTESIQPLRDLLQIVEPLSLGGHQHARRADQLTALTTLGDIAVPDAPVARDVSRWVTGALHDTVHASTYRDSLAQEFQRWRALQAPVADLAAHIPLAQDADSVTRNLVELSRAGDQALGYLARNSTAPPEWTATQAALLARTAAPVGGLRISEIPALKELFAAASGTSAAPAPAVTH